jgi:hypothetical protein
MATQIVWDEDIPLDPEPLLDNPVPPPTCSPRMPYPVTREMLEWADINDLIAELNKRGMVVTARTGVYMPATVSTSPYAQITSALGVTYTTPATTSATTPRGLGGLDNSSPFPLIQYQYQQMLQHNVCTLGASSGLIKGK